MEDIIILGFGGHAKSVADSIFRTGNYNIVGYLDIAERDSQYKYLGTDNELQSLYRKGIHMAALGVGFMGGTDGRDSLVQRVKSIGYGLPVIIDTSATLAKDVIIGEGTFVGKNAVINAGARVGNFSIINTGAIVEHDNRIGDYSHISVGAVLCGNVCIGKHTMIGANTTIIQGCKIGDQCIIGANRTVLSDANIPT